MKSESDFSLAIASQHLKPFSSCPICFEENPTAGKVWNSIHFISFKPLWWFQGQDVWTYVEWRLLFHNKHKRRWFSKRWAVTEGFGHKGFSPLVGWLQMMTMTMINILSLYPQLCVCFFVSIASQGVWRSYLWQSGRVKYKIHKFKSLRVLNFEQHVFLHSNQWDVNLFS